MPLSGVTSAFASAVVNVSFKEGWKVPSNCNPTSPLSAKVVITSRPNRAALAGGSDAGFSNGSINSLDLMTLSDGTDATAAALTPVIGTPSIALLKSVTTP